jgi:type II secretory pathway pseudopilin PulG
VYRRSEGFTLVDVLVTIAVIAILAGVATPRLQDFASGIRLGQGQREVEREMQTARLKAVTANRPMRVRFNCPVIGQYRMVELVGTPRNPDGIDDAPDRCSATKYPSPAADNNPLTTPNHDGPVRYLPRDVAFGAATDLEFWPDGSAHQRSGTTNPWPVVVPTGTAVTLTKGTAVKRITVNGLGKITLVQ